MTVIEKIAKEQYGSIRKMLIANSLKNGTVFPVLSGHRRSWPKLRQQIADALGRSEKELFDVFGWPLREKEGEVKNG